MNNDNCKATDASLIDSPEPQTPARPRKVNIALGLIGAGLLIQLFNVLRFLQLAHFQIDNLWSVATIIAGFVLMGVICHQIAHGRSWARLVLFILTLLTFVQLCWAVGFIWRRAPHMWEVILNADYLISRVLPLALNMAALHLLCFSSGDWFGSRGQSRA